MSEIVELYGTFEVPPYQVPSVLQTRELAEAFLAQRDLAGPKLYFVSLVSDALTNVGQDVLPSLWAVRIRQCLLATVVRLLDSEDSASVVSAKVTEGLTPKCAVVVNHFLAIALEERNKQLRLFAKALGVLPPGCVLTQGQANHLMCTDTEPAVIMAKLPLAMSVAPEIIVDYYDKSADFRVANYMTWIPSREGTVTDMVATFLSRLANN